MRKKKTYTLEPEGEARGRVLFFTGCIADHWLQGANHATVRLLLKAGFAVTVPAAQQCCGALHVHLGETDGGRALARENVEAFEAADPDGDALIVSNAAGCGAVLKGYAELLAHDHDYAERAQRFSSRVRDISELLASLDGALPPLKPLGMRVTWDDPCHLVHGQGVAAQPRDLIRRIPGVEFVELPEADWCCGSAGVYNIINYEMAMALLDRKLAQPEEDRCRDPRLRQPRLSAAIARRSPAEQKLDIEVLHIAELLERQM